MIPENIKPEDNVRAVAEVERLGSIPSGRDSKKYYLEYNGRHYPPKYIISLANKYANGKELNHSQFSGGNEANNFLQSLSFNIIGNISDVDGDDVNKQVADFAPKLQNYFVCDHFMYDPSLNKCSIILSLVYLAR